MRQSHPQGSRRNQETSCLSWMWGIGRKGSELVLGLLPSLGLSLMGVLILLPLDEEESRLLLAAMVNDYEQMRTRESEKAQKTEGSPGEMPCSLAAQGVLSLRSCPERYILEPPLLDTPKHVYGEDYGPSLHGL